MTEGWQFGAVLLIEAFAVGFVLWKVVWAPRRAKKRKGPDISARKLSRSAKQRKTSATGRSGPDPS